MHGAVVKLFVNVRWIPSSQKGGTGGRAVVIDVVPVKFDAFFDERVKVRGLGLAFIMCVWGGWGGGEKGEKRNKQR